MPETAPAPASPGQPPQQQQPPFGTSSATGPTPNKGYEAAGLQRLGLVLKQMGELLPLIGVTSEPGQVLMDCMKKLAKFVPSGSVTPAAEKNNIEKMAMQNASNNQQMQALRQSQQPPGGAPGGAQPGMPKVA